MDYTEQLTNEDLEIFIRILPLFKKSEFVTIDFSRKSDYLIEYFIADENGNYIYLQINDIEIRINGISRPELLTYWQSYLYRLFGDSYIEVIKKRYEESVNQTILVAPTGVPVGYDMNRAMGAINYAFMGILKIQLGNVKKHSESFWKDVEPKERNNKIKRLDDNEKSKNNN